MAERRPGGEATSYEVSNTRQLLSWGVSELVLNTH